MFRGWLQRTRLFSLSKGVELLRAFLAIYFRPTNGLIKMALLLPGWDWSGHAMSCFLTWNVLNRSVVTSAFEKHQPIKVSEAKKKYLRCDNVGIWIVLRSPLLWNCQAGWFARRAKTITVFYKRTYGSLKTCSPLINVLHDLLYCLGSLTDSVSSRK